MLSGAKSKGTTALFIHGEFTVLEYAWGVVHVNTYSALRFTIVFALAVGR